MVQNYFSLIFNNILVKIKAVQDGEKSQEQAANGYYYSTGSAYKDHLIPWVMDSSIAF